jgi:hypothetical protein
MADSKADAPFVFEGSVKSISDSNVSAVPADDKTAVVQVDHVRLAPRALAGFAGKEITLRMAANEKLAAGDRAIFFTDSLVFADHLAVQSMGHDPVVSVEAKAACGARPVVQKLRRRIDQAQAVVSGQVTEVRPSIPATVKAMAAGGPAMPVGRISEHAPFWHDAVIDVSGVQKGPRQKRVVVRFPTSTDVKWRKAPQFKKGQKGVWLLHSVSAAPVKAKSAAARLKAAAAPPAAEFYTALDPNDFHPASEASIVQAMLPVPTSTAKKSTAKAAAAKKPTLKKAAAKSAAKASGRHRRH